MTGSPAPPGRALLVALTPESRAALGAPEREIAAFPFRVGRESRGLQPTPHGFVRERRQPGSRPSNDLYLVEDEEPLNVSREHFEIDRADGGYVLVDRASTCGTIVEGDVGGGDTRRGTRALHDGDVIIVGSSRSPYAFRFRVGRVLQAEAAVRRPVTERPVGELQETLKVGFRLCGAVPQLHTPRRRPVRPW